MLREGQKVKTLTNKTGQAPRTGTVRAVRGEFVDVQWDDGRVTTMTSAHLLPDKRAASHRTR